MATTTVEPKTETVTTQSAPAARRSPGTNRGLLVGLGVAVVAVGAYFALSGTSRKETFAEEALTRARAVGESGNLPAASAQFQKVIETYKGTEAAAEAVIGLNQARIINGQTELAVVGLRDFLQSKPDAKLAVPAYGLLGTALENSGKPAEAAGAYAKAADLTAPPYLKAEYLVDAGRAYTNAGKPGDAKAAYTRVVEKLGETASATEAKVRLAELTGGVLPKTDSTASAGAKE